MPERPRGEQTTVTGSSPARGQAVAGSRIRPILGGMILAALAGGVVLRLGGGVSYEWLMVGAAGMAAVFIVFQISGRKPQPSVPPVQANDDLKEIFDSAGPMVIAIGLNGTITHMNPAAERLLGYHAEELVGTPRTSDILGPGEAPRLIAELQRLSGAERNRDMSPLE